MGEQSILKAIAREMETGVIVLDASGTVLYANPFFADSFSGGKVEALKGKPLGEILSNEAILRAVEGHLLKEGGAGGNGPETAEPEKPHKPEKLHKSEKPHKPEKSHKIEPEKIEMIEEGRAFDVRFVPLTEKDGSGLVLFIRDITEEKQLEAIKKDFVANVSHELRTPLASIKGYSETLLDGGMDDEDTGRKFLRIIDKHATRMSRLIDDLLILSRMESQPLPVISEGLDLEELIRSTVASFEKDSKDKGITLTMEFADGLPSVLGDRDRLEQVVVNLLDNAIKYTPTGGEVEVEAALSGGEVLVEVKDTGMGIPENDLSRIFERFYRVDKARSRELGGTGLGLAIVKHIIAGLGGRVWVERRHLRKAGGGSTFSFTLKPVGPRPPQIKVG